MRLLKPTLFFNSIEDITIEVLKKLDSKAAFIDIDCTLAAQDSITPFDNVASWLENIKKNKIEIVLFSNNFHSRVKTFSQQFSLPYVSFAAKPFPIALLRAKNKLNNKNIKSKNCVIIGDQIFTDILCANLGNIKSILLNPHSDMPYKLSFLRGVFEEPIRSKFSLDNKNYKDESTK